MKESLLGGGYCVLIIIVVRLIFPVFLHNLFEFNSRILIRRFWVFRIYCKLRAYFASALWNKILYRLTSRPSPALRKLLLRSWSNSNHFIIGVHMISSYRNKVTNKLIKLHSTIHNWSGRFDSVTALLNGIDEATVRPQG